VAGGEDLEVPSPLKAGPLVGRQGEVESLERWFQRATQGACQLVFVSGEAGVGKTAVVDLWLARLGAGSAVRLARGQCVEHYGEGEPYLPVLEALGQLSRGPSHPEGLAALRRYGPMWLVQLSGLLLETELEHLHHQVLGATPARRLRELAEALDVLTAKEPLLLVLEDLHWSDHSTVGSRPGRMRHDGIPITKQLPPYRKGSRCWPRCRGTPSVPDTNWSSSLP
jgi:predicted ATPase